MKFWTVKLLTIDREYLRSVRIEALNRKDASAKARELKEVRDCAEVGCFEVEKEEE